MSEKSLRGTRLGTQSLESDQGVELAARTFTSYRCPHGHATSVPFAIEAEIPEIWFCKCGDEALRVDGHGPVASTLRPVRSHWDMLLERRSVAELEALLKERVDLLRATQRARARAVRQQQRRSA